MFAVGDCFYIFVCGSEHSVWYNPEPLIIADLAIFVPLFGLKWYRSFSVLGIYWVYRLTKIIAVSHITKTVGGIQWQMEKIYKWLFERRRGSG